MHNTNEPSRAVRRYGFEPGLQWLAPQLLDGSEALTLSFPFEIRETTPPSSLFWLDDRDGGQYKEAGQDDTRLVDAKYNKPEYIALAGAHEVDWSLANSKDGAPEGSCPETQLKNSSQFKMSSHIGSACFIRNLISCIGQHYGWKDDLPEDVASTRERDVSGDMQNNRRSRPVITAIRFDSPVALDLFIECYNEIVKLGVIPANDALAMFFESKSMADSFTGNSKNDAENPVAYFPSVRIMRSDNSGWPASRIESGADTERQPLDWCFDGDTICLFENCDEDLLGKLREDRSSFLGYREFHVPAVESFEDSLRFGEKYAKWLAAGAGGNPAESTLSSSDRIARFREASSLLFSIPSIEGPSSKQQDISVDAKANSEDKTNTAIHADGIPQSHREVAAVGNVALTEDNTALILLLFYWVASGATIQSTPEVFDFACSKESDSFSRLSAVVRWMLIDRSSEDLSRQLRELEKGKKGLLTRVPDGLLDDLGFRSIDSARGTDLIEAQFFSVERRAGGEEGYGVYVKDSPSLRYYLGFWLFNTYGNSAVEEATLALRNLKALSNACSPGFMPSVIFSYIELVVRKGHSSKLGRRIVSSLADSALAGELGSITPDEIVALSLRSNCGVDDSSIKILPLWNSFFFEKTVSSNQADVFLERYSKTALRPANINTLQFFSEIAIERLSDRLYSINGGFSSNIDVNLIDKYENACWTELLTSGNISLMDVSDDYRRLACVDCLTFASYFNVRVPFVYNQNELLTDTAISTLLRGLTADNGLDGPLYILASQSCWFYLLAHPWAIPANALGKIGRLAAEIVYKNECAALLEAALRVLSCLPFTAFSELGDAEHEVVRLTTKLITIAANSASLSGYALCALLKCDPALFLVAGLLPPSVFEYDNSLGCRDSYIFNEVSCELNLRSTFHERLGSDSELNNIAYMVGRGFGTARGYSQQDAAVILSELDGETIGIFPFINTMLYQIQIADDVAGALVFWKERSACIELTDYDANQAVAFWGALANANQPEGLLALVLLEKVLERDLFPTARYRIPVTYGFSRCPEGVFIEKVWKLRGSREEALRIIRHYFGEKAVLLVESCQMKKNASNADNVNETPVREA
ncbi:MAG TPA: hypothetical protein IAA69_01030 [Candidatus Aveggerthella stercoripullorum]|uniref:Uncharacterized protein n=1 Tax=Candidatus Aveggerthella stercoripullorum TaxID=2840688 RepID=A0A9D1A0L3_9ACTN|nr:hypothetical protein [Candidatus Aveggerthella stercoripullorum]